jgi:hypothetical protein
MHPNKKSLGAAYGTYRAELFLHCKGHSPFGESDGAGLQQSHGDDVRREFESSGREKE